MNSNLWFRLLILVGIFGTLSGCFFVESKVFKKEDIYATDRNCRKGGGILYISKDSVTCSGGDNSFFFLINNEIKK